MAKKTKKITIKNKNTKYYNWTTTTCRSRGFLLHGPVLSTENRITVLSPPSRRFIKSLWKVLKPSNSMFIDALTSLSCSVLQMGHFHSFLSFNPLWMYPQVLHFLLDGNHWLIWINFLPYHLHLYFIIFTSLYKPMDCSCVLISLFWKTRYVKAEMLYFERLRFWYVLSNPKVEILWISSFFFFFSVALFLLINSWRNNPFNIFSCE